MPAQRHSQLPRTVQLLLALGLIVALVYLGWQQRQEHDRPDGGAKDNPAEKLPAAQPGTVIQNVTIRDRDGEVVYRGNVDLSRTIARIQAGKSLPQFRNDGSVFQNRERRLPRHQAGYYREWVHPTPRLSGPGPQRIVTGEKGEFYYTPDHYETFQRLRLESAK
ncbi:MAG TPA: ribonuclease domain-containing protein [Pirellulaceae bacterium]|nr:ribonuclease domain-containing protein [Pirellulaceae bacterium]